MKTVCRSLTVILTLHLCACLLMPVHAEGENPADTPAAEETGEEITAPEESAEEENIPSADPEDTDTEEEAAESAAPSEDPENSDTEESTAPSEEAAAEEEVISEAMPEETAPAAAEEEPAEAVAPIADEEAAGLIKPAVRISLEQTSYLLNLKEKTSILAEAGEGVSLVYESKDASIVSVDENGKLTALKKGKTLITVSDADHTAEAVIPVAVKGKSDESYELMYRLYNPNSGEHFYTAALKERDTLILYGWKYEGYGWAAPMISAKPVYRLYNSYVGDHHYTMSPKERDALVKIGWTDEGIGWYSDEAETVALYRQYNPNAETGMHNYTVSKAENGALKSYGWIEEGIGWYGVTNPKHANYRKDGRYVQVDPDTGEVIHSQKLFNDKIWWEGIDISEHNDDIDLAEYQDGFVIIRISYSTKEDHKAKRNMDLCEKLNIPYGVYVYSYALNAKEAEKEAEYALQLLKGRNVQCGVWFDMEDADFYKIRRNRNFYNRKLISSICQAFCAKTKAAGYHTGIYASYAWFVEFIKGCDAYDKWVAHWGRDDGRWHENAYEAAISIDASIHQYACKPLDKNVMYVDPIYLTH